MKKAIKIKNKYLRRLTYLTLGFIVYCLVAVISLLVFTNKSLLDYPQLIQSPPNIDYFIQLDLSLQAQDLDLMSATYLVSFTQNGKASQGASVSWDRDLTFSFFPSILQVKKGQIIKPFKFGIDLTDGNPKDYPFDIYSTELAFLVQDSNTNQTVPIGMNASVRTISTLTEFQQKPVKSSDGSTIYYFSLSVYRAKIVYVFCFFVSFLTWILTVLMLIMAYDTQVNGRVLAAPIISLGVAILFALPALRSTQPGIPGIGCAIDYLCFFWCETLVALSSCFIIGCYTLRYKKGEEESAV
jgi:hypothetical protein